MNHVLVPLPPIGWGGLQTFALNINAHLRKRGWAWVVAVPDEAQAVRDRLVEGGVDAVTLPMSRLRRSPVASLRAVAALRGEMRALAELGRSRHVSLVQAVGAHHYHGAFAARKLGVPLVWQVHSSIVPRPLRPPVARLIDRLSDVVMTNGRVVASAFWGDAGPRQDHFVFYAPVNATRFAPDPVARAEKRREMGIDQEVVVIATVGNRVWQKNHELLVSVAERLAALYPCVRFLVMGAAVSTYAAAYRNGVEARVSVLNARLPGFVTILDPGREVPAFLAASDIFVLTSHAEGVPIALAEAMSTGLPAVSTDVGSIREIILPGEVGDLAPAGDAAALADALRVLIDDARLRQAFGAAARARMLEDFALEKVVDVHVAAYQRALEKPPRHRTATGPGRIPS